MPLGTESSNYPFDVEQSFLEIELSDKTCADDFSAAFVRLLEAGAYAGTINANLD